MLARVMPDHADPAGADDVDGEFALEALHLILERPEKENMPFCSRMKLKSWFTPLGQLLHQQLAHLANAHPHGGHFFHPLRIEGGSLTTVVTTAAPCDGGLE